MAEDIEGTPPARDPGETESDPEVFEAIVRKVLDDERFVDSVKHFIGRGDSLLLRSDIDPVGTMWVAVMESSEGSSVQLIGNNETIDYCSDVSEVYLQRYPTIYMRQMERRKFERFLDHLPREKVSPDMLRRLEIELGRPDFTVDQSWLAQRLEDMPFTLGRPAGEAE